MDAESEQKGGDEGCWKSFGPGDQKDGMSLERTVFSRVLRRHSGRRCPRTNIKRLSDTVRTDILSRGLVNHIG